MHFVEHDGTRLQDFQETLGILAGSANGGELAVEVPDSRQGPAENGLA